MLEHRSCPALVKPCIVHTLHHSTGLHATFTAPIVHTLRHSHLQQHPASSAHHPRDFDALVARARRHRPAAAMLTQHVTIRGPEKLRRERGSRGPDSSHTRDPRAPRTIRTWGSNGGRCARRHARGHDLAGAGAGRGGGRRARGAGAAAARLQRVPPGGGGQGIAAGSTAFRCTCLSDAAQGAGRCSSSAGANTHPSGDLSLAVTTLECELWLRALAAAPVVLR